jgi:hypothetical protein
MVAPLFRCGSQQCHRVGHDQATISAGAWLDSHNYGFLHALKSPNTHNEETSSDYNLELSITVHHCVTKNGIKNNVISQDTEPA